MYASQNRNKRALSILDHCALVFMLIMLTNIFKFSASYNKL